MPPVAIPNIQALKNYVGKSLGFSEWHLVDQDQIQAFAEVTGDFQWIHVDTERASRESPFNGKTVAHGHLTLSLAPVLLPEIVVVENTSMVVNYGVEKARFPSPVKAGDRVRMEAELKNVRVIRGGAARACYKLTIRSENATKPACNAEVIYIYYPAAK
ncbi:MAG: MaoC family dehydratase [Deltaproteobacteria bacterium]|nr:MaoC family dehydratase [Deltaproteobacteria bacterium]